MWAAHHRLVTRLLVLSVLLLVLALLAMLVVGIAQSGPPTGLALMVRGLLERPFPALMAHLLLVALALAMRVTPRLTGLARNRQLVPLVSMKRAAHAFLITVKQMKLG